MTHENRDATILLIAALADPTLGAAQRLPAPAIGPNRPA